MHALPPQPSLHTPCHAVQMWVSSSTGAGRGGGGHKGRSRAVGGHGGERSREAVGSGLVQSSALIAEGISDRQHRTRVLPLPDALGRLWAPLGLDTASTAGPRGVRGVRGAQPPPRNSHKSSL